MITMFLCVCVYRVVQHSERPFAYAIDWLCQRVAGESIICAMEVMFFIGVTLFVCLRDSQK